MAQVQDDEPALLLTKYESGKGNRLLLNEGDVVPKLRQDKKKETESNVLYLDNGASNHMTGQRTKFKELDEKITGKVRFGDGSTVEIKGKCSVTFKCRNGEDVRLDGVYYIPTLYNNIISLGQLSENGKKVILNGVHLWVYDERGRLLMNVKRTANRLYKIILECNKPNCLMSVTKESSWLWHLRLGHVNFNSMKLLSDKKMARGLPKLVKPKKACVQDV